MTQFLTTEEVVSNLSKIIRTAKQKLILVSPYLKLSKMLYERLEDADGRGVKTCLIYGKDELKSDQRSQLEQLQHLSVYFCENLHAKCYFNEDLMVITSWNMYEFSEKNREMGIFVAKNEDADVFKAAMNEVQSILKASEKQDFISKTFYKQPAITSSRNESTRKTKKKPIGYCIRCHSKISFDLKRPLCKDCFRKWSEYENYDYLEKYCHACGEKRDTSMEHPVWFPCIKKAKNAIDSIST